MQPTHCGARLIRDVMLFVPDYLAPWRFRSFRSLEALTAAAAIDQPTTSAACWLWPSVMPRAFIQS